MIKNITLYDGVELYKNVFKDLDGMLDIVENFHSNGENKYSLQDWESWYTFGSQRHVNSIYFDKSYNLDPNDLTKNVVDEIENIFYNVTELYFKKYKIYQPDWHHSGFTICKYQEHFDARDGLVMQYHTDFQQLKRDQPGTKHMITCTMYLNDDYDGGEVSFYIGNDLFHYKPKKGDVLVWPSTPPFYHGVKKVENKPKYFVRTFWFEDREATEDWKRSEKIFGPENWKVLEENREKSNTYQFIKYPHNNDKVIDITKKVMSKVYEQ